MGLDLVLQAARVLGPGVVVVALCVTPFCVFVRRLAVLLGKWIDARAEAEIRAQAERQQLEVIARARSDELRLIVLGSAPARLPEAIAALTPLELKGSPAVTGTDGASLPTPAKPPVGLHSVPTANES